MMRMCSHCWVYCVAAVVLVGLIPSTGWAASPEVGRFLGLFTYTQARIPLAEQAENIDRLLGSNPYLKGLTIRVLWKEEEPEEGRFDWKALDRIIAVAHARHVCFTLDPVAGVMTPDWVYRAGANRFDMTDINPHHPTYGQTQHIPVPWNGTYRRLWRNFLKQLAARYGNDQSLLEVTVNGHSATVEMHMPRRPDDMDHWRQLGWSPELVEDDWKGWIDFFAETFPRPYIGLMMSPMYDRSTMPIVEHLAAYAVRKYANRLILMTAVLHGRSDQAKGFQTRICLEYPQVLNAQEAVSTFKDAARQGSIEMFVYNMRQLSPLFVRLWRNDVQSVEECHRILAEYQHARSMSVANYQRELQSKGLYTTVDSYQPGQGKQMGRFGGFGRRRQPSAPGFGTYPRQEPYPGQSNPVQNTYPAGDTQPE